MSEPLSEALAEALRPLVTQLVRDEVKRAGFEWGWRTAEQAAEILGVTPAAVRQRVQAGQLPGRKEYGRIYVDLRAFDEQLRAGGRATVGANPKRDRGDV